MTFMQDRELSWLYFNQRVLEEAADPRIPLLERLKFVAIFCSNLDEFFMVRCGSLYDLSLVEPKHKDHRSFMTPGEELDAIYSVVADLYPKKDEVEKNINHTLESLHMARLSKSQLNKKQLKWMEDYFDSQVAPLLSALILDWQHPFPHLLNKAQYIIVRLKEKDKEVFGIVPVPDYLTRVIYVPDMQGSYVLVEHMIYHMVHKVFNSYEILSKSIIRVTRNADINLNTQEMDEDEDYRDYMKTILKKRKRLAPIRLEYYKHIDKETKEYLAKQLNLKEDQMFESRTTMEMSHVFDVIDHAPKNLAKPLLYEPYTPNACQNYIPELPIIPQVLAHDLILFYPFEDIDIFLKLLNEASQSKQVVSIKITIYRLAKNSKIVHALQNAAENGIEVTVLMELRARFDEQHNISAAQELEQAGCTIIYGFEKYKVHSKLLQIVLKTHKGMKTITQIGTGNYNEKTSRMYTDISYITARSEIGLDAQHFFQNMSLSDVHGKYNQLWVSPNQLKHCVLQAIDEQIERAQSHQNAFIALKMNSMTDVQIMEKLQKASCAGVKIHMIIRGICCILPGIEGQTENIEVHSIVGRFLEHSRIYWFGPKEDCKVYISSADFMTRNTEKRVEVASPILDVSCKALVMKYFEDQWRDNVKTRIILPDGSYTAINSTDEPYDYQDAYIRKEYHPETEIKGLKAFLKKLKLLHH